jgi:hypothetical protein
VNASEHVAHDRLVDACLLPSQLLSLEVLRRPLDFTQYASIASAGNAYDAMCESFFATL